MAWPRPPLLVLAVLLVPAAPAAADGGGEAVEAVLTLDEPLDDALASTLQEIGLEGLEAYDVADAVGVRGTPDQVEAAARLDGVEDAYPSEPLETHLAESRVTIDANPPYQEDGLAGRNVTVAVVDSGIDADHPGFGDRVAAGRSFDEDGAHRSREDHDGHGTHIAGIVGGSGARSEDARLRGVAPGSGLVGLDISDPFTTKNALRAFEWIHDHHEEHGIRVVTNSWGRAEDQPRYDPDDPLIRASDALVDDGLVVVFSAGNQGPRDSTLTVEAMNPSVLTVGATDEQGRLAEYSSRGPALDEDGDPLPWVKPDVVAPGTHITSTRSQSGEAGLQSAVEAGNRWYVTMNGTSMAAPHVAGIAALLLEERPSLTPAAVSAILQASAGDRGPEGPDPGYGHGLANARTALRTLAIAEEGKVVVETRSRVPLDDDGEVTGAPGYVVADGGSFHAPPQETVTSSFDVPPRSASANVSFSWEDDRASFQVTLEGPGEDHGPYRPASGANVVWANVTGPEEGEWTLRAEPREPTRTSWSLGGHVTVVETRVLEGAEGLLGADSPPLHAGSSYFDDASRGDAVLRGLGDALPAGSHPVLTGLGLASLAGGLVARFRPG